jgi:hypothetical protein
MLTDGNQDRHIMKSESMSQSTSSAPPCRWFSTGADTACPALLFDDHCTPNRRLVSMTGDGDTSRFLAKSEIIYRRFRFQRAGAPVPGASHTLKSP